MTLTTNCNAKLEYYIPGGYLCWYRVGMYAMYACNVYICESCPCADHKGICGSINIDPRNLNLGIKWSSVVSFLPQSLFFRSTVKKKKRRKSLPVLRYLGHPTRSQFTLSITLSWLLCMYVCGFVSVWIMYVYAFVCIYAWLVDYF